MSPNWIAPNLKVNTAGATTQAPGLRPLDPTATPAPTNVNFLPPVATQPFNDGAGSASFAIAGSAVWEDDLIMTGVRSFDIKAYDDAYAGYVDLGWGDDLRLYQPYYGTSHGTATPPSTPLYLAATQSLDPATETSIVTGGRPILVWPPNRSSSILPPVPQRSYDMFSRSCAHEGRIPPLGNDPSNPVIDDNRFDPQALEFNLSFNVGHNLPGVIRLRRVWDSWSTDYTRAPASGFDPVTKEPRGLLGKPTDLPSGRRPIYPSYPPPYEMPLRGIQIQIRVVDPRNERIKVLTIRQDFSDKL